MEKDKESSIMDLNCIRLTEEAIETINSLQTRGTDLEEKHTDKDFDDFGIDDTIKILSSISDFIVSIYRWKMAHLEGTDKVDFAFEVLSNFNRIDYIKAIFNSLRVNPEYDEFDRQPKQNYIAHGGSM
ncbi:MAG: hypothetical protein M1445_11645 [Bacteroidetes bacterium]|nr:hypothetical protein [Bacteroidota bacterium]MCL6101605.1 hypothetical protein [Bacteroidota bacterium]